MTRQPGGVGLQDVRRAVAVLLTAIALAGCAVETAGDAVIEDLEQQLSSDVVPLLAEQGLTDATWDAFRAAIRNVRTDDLHVTLASGAGGGEGGGEPAAIEAIVTFVGPQAGACVAVVVMGDGSVRTAPVDGDPTANCEGAEVPDAMR